MTNQFAAELKLVFVPWGATDYGEDVWLLENSLIFGIESLLDQLQPSGAVQFADLYNQLGGESKRSAFVPAYLEPEIRQLAARTPMGTDAIVDGLLVVKRDPDTLALAEVQVSPRLLLLPKGTWEAPDSFVFNAFSAHRRGRDELRIADTPAWFQLVVHLTEVLLAPFGIELPALLDESRLEITQNWDAYTDFLKAKRGSRTPEEKLGYYRQAIRHDSAFYWARFNAGQLHKQEQDYHSARREFLACINAAEGDPALLSETYFELGLCSIFLGDTKTARGFWDQSLHYSPDNPTVLVNIAGTYEQEEDWQTAIALHERALAQSPDYYKAIVSVARLKAQLGKLDEAIPLYIRALELKPDDALRHAILAGCYLAAGDLDEARTHFSRASELDPPGATARPIHIDEAEAPPPPGDYARQELAKMDEAARAQEPENKGWRWFRPKSPRS